MNLRNTLGLSIPLPAFPLGGSLRRSRRHRNYLFAITDNASPIERAILFAAAERMREHGYVYIADVACNETHDVDDVRFLPLRYGQLPRFGELTMIVVLNDQDLAAAATALHPEALTFVLSSVPEDEGYSVVIESASADEGSGCRLQAE